MPPHTQDTRTLELQTPLGKDVLLIRSFQGTEGLSQLFEFTVEAMAPNTATIDFSKIVGQLVTVRIHLDSKTNRYFNGLVKSFTRGQKAETATAFTLEIVPRLWLLTRRTQSRIFQHENVPDILKKVLEGIDVKFEIQGTFQPRNYCTQYRETDFAFASRLMEEEGIYYFFQHSDDGHKMIVANTPQSHLDLPYEKKLWFDDTGGGVEDRKTIFSWRKTQHLTPGKITLYDHCFELPHKHLEAQEVVMDSVTSGEETHKLKIGGNDKLELYDYPGYYAQRFDGIATGGGEQSGELQKIFEDNKRTTGIRMQQETAQTVQIAAETEFAGIYPGHVFELTRHHIDNGEFVVANAHYYIEQGGSYMAGDSVTAPPHVNFTCFPKALPFRPPRLTPRPVVYGTQTAVVVGPAGEEIHTDKYGRIKVQFHWDRDGKMDGSSSCWVRCASPWAGKNFGAISIPRIGWEVVVAFQEGDPDHPIGVGCVYNADMMPPWELPANKTQSGFQSRSSPGAGSDNLNVLKFEDKKGEEFIFIHGEKDFHTRVKNDIYTIVQRDVHTIIDRDLFEEIKNDSHLKVANNVQQEFGADHSLKVKGKQMINVGSSHSTKIGGACAIEVSGAMSTKVAGSTYIKSDGPLVIEAPSIHLKTSSGSINIGASGISIKASGQVAIDGSMTMINCGMATPGGPGSQQTIVGPVAPKAVTESMKPTSTGTKSYSASPDPMKALPPHNSSAFPAPSPTAPPPADEEKKKHFIEIEVFDEDNLPVPGEPYEIITPEGTLASGSTDEKGYARVDGIEPGTATVRLPRRDKSVNPS
jgi:type VI secretion system secreted protein VgrG